MAVISFSAPAASKIGIENVSITYTTAGVITELGDCTELLYNGGVTRDVLTSVSVYINDTLKGQETTTSRTDWEIAHGSKGASFTIQLKLSYNTYKASRFKEGTTTVYYYCTYNKASGGVGITDFYATEDEARGAVPIGATNVDLYIGGGDPIYSYYWGLSSSNNSVSSTKYTCYGKPDPWAFAYSNNDYTWVVDKGIQTLITNITSFPAAAKKYKQWEKQSAQDDCNSLFSNNELSASKINSALEYTTGTKGTYKAGDDVSKAIFNSLQSKINYSTS